MNKRLRCTAFLVLCMMTVAQMPLIADEKKEDHTPVPYTKEEFPLWQRELRRFEILSFGALPFVTLLSCWGYDMIRAAKHPKDPAYYPWPFKKADKAVALTEKEQLGVFLTAAGISVTIALIDITYRAIKRAVAKKRLERENAFIEDPIQFRPTTLPLEDEPAPSENTGAEPVEKSATGADKKDALDAEAGGMKTGNRSAVPMNTEAVLLAGSSGGIARLFENTAIAISAVQGRGADTTAQYYD